MKLLSRYLVILAAIIGFAHTLPDLYSTTASKTPGWKNYSYSKVLGDFVSSRSDIEGNRFYYDNRGHEIEKREYAKLLPFSYSSDLNKWGEWPETIGGVPVTLEEVRQEDELWRISISGMDWARARIKLYPMFESQSGFIEIVLPQELFRITDTGLEFVNADKNKVLEERSTLFTNAMLDQGFVFPAKRISGNPTTRKPYDFGYFIMDARNEIYHVYMAKGLPNVIKTNIKPEGEIIHIAIAEGNPDRYGILVTREGGLYQISKDNYKLTKLFLRDYDTSQDYLIYSLNPLNVTVRLTRGNTERIYISDRNNEEEAFFEYTTEPRLRGIYKTVYDLVFPFKLGPNYSKAGLDLKLMPSDNIRGALLVSVILALVYALFRSRRGGLDSPLPVDIAIVLIGGFYGLAALMLLDLLGYKKAKTFKNAGQPQA